MTRYASHVTTSLYDQNPNRGWLYASIGSYPALVERAESNALPWPGALPMPFAVLRRILMGKLVVDGCLQLSNVAASLGPREFLLELHRPGYPPWTLRASVHALHSSTVASLARESVRAWLRHLHRTNCERTPWTTTTPRRPKAIGDVEEIRGGGRVIMKETAIIAGTSDAIQAERART